MALPLLATGSASAADASTWDRVAECESGGQWSANFGNGMYGGLQFTQDSWERNGGLAYAPSPDLASRAQQIAVAEKALAKGSTEWATCAPIAGLTNDGKDTGVDPGPTSVPKAPTGPVVESNRTDGLPSASAEAAEEAKEATAVPSPVTSTTPGAPDSSVTPGMPVTPGTPTTPGAPDESVTPGTPVSPGEAEGDMSSTAPGSGKHRGEAAAEEAGKPGKSGESGKHASSTDKSADGSSVTPTADGVNNSDATDSQDTLDAYTVQPGDSLSDIAQSNELPGGWTALYDANRQTVGADPNLILPGQSLELTKDSVSAEG